MSDHRAEAQSVVMRSATKTIRFVHSIHHTAMFLVRSLWQHSLHS
ncbi:hypothetical protein [Paenibacillus polymyxa]|nr:hypothetical protein [Paenibacillus polymyxa]